MSWRGLTLLLVLMFSTSVQADEVADLFEKSIRPLFVKHCYQCHGPDEAAAKLRLDSKGGWQRGGERGPAIVPHDPSASLLMVAVSYRDEKLKMPPEDSGGKLSQRELDDLTTWIRQGAFDPRGGQSMKTEIDDRAQSHWAFQPIVAPPLDTDSSASHPIDHLIDQQLMQRGFMATPPADMPTLIRRATFDLHGLPPTIQQLATPREAFPKLVQELLASPRYGERWGRHWLDVARYSDAKDGVLMYGDARVRPFAYTYRDYVIRAFNDDLPYDQFIHQQLAADQLNLPADSPALAAMGLLTLGRMFDRNLHDVIDDQIDVLSRGLLGLTVSCARCHDHKFDPIPTADYYSLYGVFASCIEPYDRPRIEPVTEKGQAFETEFAAKLAEVTQQQLSHYEAQLQTARERTADYLVHVATTEPDVAETAIFFLSLTPEQLRPQITKRWRQLIARRAFPDDPVFGAWYDLMREPRIRSEEWLARGVHPRVVQALVDAQPKTAADVAKTYGDLIVDCWKQTLTANQGSSSEQAIAPLAKLLTERDSPVWFPKEAVANYLSRTPGDKYRGLLGELDAIAVKHADAAARAMVLVDNEVLCDPVIFQRGDPGQRGAPVPRRFLSALMRGEPPIFENGSGRLDLARALTSADNPLTARVWANRVWMHHFGEPLVDTPSDFGLQTKRPLHHKLLDYLANYLMQHGWHTKALHELIMSSQAYQRASQLPSAQWASEQLALDPDNKWLWHANRRRLDWEQMRDTLLLTSGELDTTMYGRPRVVTDPSNQRRTVYAFVERQNIPAEVQTFDFANADTSTPRRTATTVPQQALFAMNSSFVLARSRALASLVQKSGSRDSTVKDDTVKDDTVKDDTVEDVTEEVVELYRRVHGRRPRPEELTLASEFVKSASLEQLAQVLLMSNELLFVD